jgi:hypothetical protein
MQPHLLIWSSLNNVGVVLENVARIVADNRTYSRLEVTVHQKFYIQPTPISKMHRHNIPKWRKIYLITINYTKWPQNTPNCRKIDQMVIKYTNIRLQDPPKCTHIGIFGLKICHLATLVEAIFLISPQG